MKKKTLLATSFLMVGVIQQTMADEPSTQPEEQLGFFAELDREMDRMLKRVKKMSEYMDHALNSDFDEKEASETRQVRKQKIGLSENEDYVVIAFDLPEVDVRTVDIEAHGKNLTGKIPLEGKKIAFEVRDGLLRIMEEMSKEKKEDKDDVHSYQGSFGLSTQVMSLPSRLANLEDSIVEYVNGQLLVKLPKYKVQKPVGKKLNVAVK